MEFLLEGLGADAAYRDAILGDLTEEFAQRVSRDGVVSARRWYFRESLRTTPHLLRRWLHSSSWGDFGHLVGVVVTANFLLLVPTFLVAVMARSFLAGIGLIAAGPIAQTSGVGFAILAFLMGIAMSVAGGYIAAWLNDRAPLVSALAYGVIVAAAETISLGVTWWPQVLLRAWVLPMAVGLACVGGTLRLRALRREKAIARQAAPAGSK